jgi:hypothetical protein
MLQEPVEAVASPECSVNMVDSTGENSNYIRTPLGMILFVYLWIIRSTCLILLIKCWILSRIQISLSTNGYMELISHFLVLKKENKTSCRLVRSNAMNI